MTFEDAQDLWGRFTQTGTLHLVFQPLIALSTGNIIGYEMLSRPYGTDGHLLPVEEFFEAVAITQHASALDVTIMIKLANFLKSHDVGQPVFFNVHPDTFTPEFMEDIVSRIRPESLVIELTERGDWSAKDKAETIQDLQRRGGSLAMDDFGTGYSGLQKLVSVRPNYVKLDRSLIDFCDQDPVKRNLISSVEHISKLLGFQIIAEGIEREEEMITCMELGVDIGQGFYFARPLGWDQQNGLRPELIDTILVIHGQQIQKTTKLSAMDRVFRNQLLMLTDFLTNIQVGASMQEVISAILSTSYKVLKPFSTGCYIKTDRGFRPIGSVGHAVKKELIGRNGPSFLTHTWEQHRLNIIQHASAIKPVVPGSLRDQIGRPESIAVTPVGNPAWGVLTAEYLKPMEWNDTRVQSFQTIANLLTLVSLNHPEWADTLTRYQTSDDTIFDE